MNARLSLEFNVISTKTKTKTKQFLQNYNVIKTLWKATTTTSTSKTTKL